eukprot:TRINITY_DN2920_c0_g1_i1.p1 TRINITY_DN2920_c0_g1~~TRINITY_DN2920_c0_g1_i1.p1  ORF type:complete len:1402 (-),score=341.29 TRINITY_DN2920_c0_g1_i1:103-4281(-)
MALWTEVQPSSVVNASTSGSFFPTIIEKQRQLVLSYHDLIEVYNFSPNYSIKTEDSLSKPQFLFQQKFSERIIDLKSVTLPDGKVNCLAVLFATCKVVIFGLNVENYEFEVISAHNFENRDDFNISPEDFIDCRMVVEPSSEMIGILMPGNFIGIIGLQPDNMSIVRDDFEEKITPYGKRVTIPTFVKKLYDNFYVRNIKQIMFVPKVEKAILCVLHDARNSNPSWVGFNTLSKEDYKKHQEISAFKINLASQSFEMYWKSSPLPYTVNEMYPTGVPLTFLVQNHNEVGDYELQLFRASETTNEEKCMEVLPMPSAEYRKKTKNPHISSYIQNSRHVIAVPDKPFCLFFEGYDLYKINIPEERHKKMEITLITEDIILYENSTFIDENTLFVGSVSGKSAIYSFFTLKKGIKLDNSLEFESTLPDYEYDENMFHDLLDENDERIVSGSIQGFAIGESATSIKKTFEFSSVGQIVDFSLIENPKTNLTEIATVTGKYGESSLKTLKNSLVFDKKINQELEEYRNEMKFFPFFYSGSKFLLCNYFDADETFEILDANLVKVSTKFDLLREIKPFEIHNVDNKLFLCVQKRELFLIQDEEDRMFSSVNKYEFDSDIINIRSSDNFSILVTFDENVYIIDHNLQTVLHKFTFNSLNMLIDIAAIDENSCYLAIYVNHEVLLYLFKSEERELIEKAKYSSNTVGNKVLGYDSSNSLSFDIGYDAYHSVFTIQDMVLLTSGEFNTCILGLVNNIGQIHIYNEVGFNTIDELVFKRVNLPNLAQFNTNTKLRRFESFINRSGFFVIREDQPLVILVDQANIQASIIHVENACIDLISFVDDEGAELIIFEESDDFDINSNVLISIGSISIDLKVNSFPHGSLMYIEKELEGTPIFICYSNRYDVFCICISEMYLHFGSREELKMQSKKSTSYFESTVDRNVAAPLILSEWHKLLLIDRSSSKILDIAERLEIKEHYICGQFSDIRVVKESSLPSIEEMETKFDAPGNITKEHVLLLGTGIMHGEDNVSYESKMDKYLGRVIMMQVSAEKDGTLKFNQNFLTYNQSASPCVSIGITEGYIVAKFEKHIHLLIYMEARGVLKCIAFTRSEHFSKTMKCLRNIVAIGDLYSGVQILHWQRRFRKLDSATRDGSKRPSLQCEFLLLPSPSKNELSSMLVCSTDIFRNLRLFVYDTSEVEVSQDETEGQKWKGARALIEHTVFRSGHVFTCSQRQLKSKKEFNNVSNVGLIYFSSLAGSLHVLSSLSKDKISIKSSMDMQQKIEKSIKYPGNLTYTNANYIFAIDSQRNIINSDSFRYFDSVGYTLREKVMKDLLFEQKKVKREIIEDSEINVKEEVSNTEEEINVKEEVTKYNSHITEINFKEDPEHILKQVKDNYIAILGLI